MALFFEALFFSKTYLLADKSALCVIYKSGLIQSRQSADVLILGRSRGLAIDAKGLEQSLDERLTVCNLALPSLATDLQLYLILKKYLGFCKKPQLIIAEEQPESFCERAEDDLKVVDKPRLRRFVSFRALWGEVPLSQLLTVLPDYAKNMIPSMNYSYFIKTFLSKKNIGLFTASMDRGESIIKDLRSTNGQLLYLQNSVVSDEEIQMNFPKDPRMDRIRNFEKFVALCDKNEIRTVFMMMPIHRARYDEMRRLGWFDYIDGQMERLKKKYKHFEYYKINDLSFEEKYFADWSHLNEVGVHKFNEAFKIRLKALLPTPTAA